MSSHFVGDRGLELEHFAPTAAPIARSAAVAQAEPSAAIDLVSLLRRCVDDATFCAMILHKFAARSEDQLLALERALASSNVVELARQAHTLEGVAANLSAPKLREQAAELERAAHRGDLPAARRALTETRAELHRCRELVPALIKQLTK